MTVKKDTQKSAKGFTDAEKSAMKERARELKAEARASKDRESGERDVLAAIAKLPDADRIIGERLHAIITAHAPSLLPKTWYGMPAYARDGKVVCFYQAAQKFGTRYGTLGFNDSANLDDGAVWPVAYAVKALNAAEESRIIALVKQAIS